MASKSVSPRGVHVPLPGAHSLRSLFVPVSSQRLLKSFGFPIVLRRLSLFVPVSISDTGNARYPPSSLLNIIRPNFTPDVEFIRSLNTFFAICIFGADSPSVLSQLIQWPVAYVRLRPEVQLPLVPLKRP